MEYVSPSSPLPNSTDLESLNFSIFIEWLGGEWGDERGQREEHKWVLGLRFRIEETSQEARKVQEGSCRSQLGMGLATPGYLQKNPVWITYIYICDSSKQMLMYEMYIQFLIIYKWQWAEVWMTKIQPSRDLLWTTFWPSPSTNWSFKRITEKNLFTRLVHFQANWSFEPKNENVNCKREIGKEL